jgi:hypothetical protein
LLLVLEIFLPDHHIMVVLVNPQPLVTTTSPPVTAPRPLVTKTPPVAMPPLLLEDLTMQQNTPLLLLGGLIAQLVIARMRLGEETLLLAATLPPLVHPTALLVTDPLLPVTPTSLQEIIPPPLVPDLLIFR